MNVLQRKMFANGDVVNSPLVDVTAQIANLSLNGLAPIEIFELLQADYASKGLQMPSNLGMATIESIAKQVGGKAKIDPTFIGPKRPLDPSRIDQIGIAPFNVSPEIAPDRLPPADPSLDPRLGTYAQQGDTLNPAATPDVVDFSEDLQGLMDTDITVEGDEQPEKKLGPNEIRLSDGRVIDFSQGIKDIQEGKGKGAFIYRIFNSPDIETGENVDKALTQFINLDEPGAIRFFGELGGGTLEERRGTAFGPEDIGSGLIAGAKGLFDFGREGLATILPGAISPFVGRETVENVREFFDADFPEGYAARGGFSPETIDNIVLSAAGIKEDKIAKDLEEIGITEDKQTPIKPEVEVFEEDVEDVEEEPESVADAAVGGKQPGVEDQTDAGDQPDAGAGLPGAVDEDVPPPPKSKEVSFAEFTTSPDFLRFVRNIGKGLVTQGELGKGIALGAAAAAEERAQEEALKAERDAELLKEMIEKGGSDLSPSDIKGLNTQVSDLNKVIKEYEAGEASIGLMNELIGLFTTAEQRGVAVTGLGGQFNIAMDKLKTFLGRDFDTSDATQIQQAINQVKQRSIRDILQESGRTISDLDRQIVDKIFGEIDFFTPPDQIAKKLNKARNDLIDSNREKKRTITSSYTLIQNPVYEGVGVTAISPYISLIDRIMKADPSKGAGLTLGEVLNIDIREQNLLN